MTVRYDFSQKSQLEDFQTLRPAGLLPDAGTARWRIENKQLVLEGTGCLAHKAGRVRRAVFQLTARHQNDLGFFLGPIVADMIDHRFAEAGGFFLASCRFGKDFKYRELARAPAVQIQRRFAKGKPGQIAFDAAGYVRLGSLWRAFGPKKPGLKDPQKKQTDGDVFGFWVRESAVAIDELVLTIELPTALPRRGDAALSDLSEGKLAKLVADYPLSADAAAARRVLSARGEKGWKKLYSLARRFARKEPYAARPVAVALAAGPEPERAKLLRKLYPKHGPVDLQLTVLRGLARWYPDHTAFLQAGLQIEHETRVDLFRDLVRRGLSSAALQEAVKIPALAEEAREILKDRGRRAKALGDLPAAWAREALSPVAARAILDDFAKKPDFRIVTRLVELLRHEDKSVRRGAQLLLMMLSGLDLPPDADLWRSWISAKRDNYKKPVLSAPGVVAAAIDRGAKFLRADLLKDGRAEWPSFPDSPETVVGATGLAVYALRAAGVPADDPAIRKALEKTLLPGGALPGVRRYTYALSMLTLALKSVDEKAHAQSIRTLARRIWQGQLDNGQWTYHCHDKVYERRPGRGDNSNTQYAILALREAWRAGFKAPAEVWAKNAAYWRKSVNRTGGWGYGPRGTTKHEFSMTTAGVATLAICIEALSGNEVTKKVKTEDRIVRGMKRLGELLLDGGYTNKELYAFYGVERACILTGVKQFDDFDWYAEGAAIIVRRQKENGAWGDPAARGVQTGRGYGEAIDTAYALLFLKRATTGLAGAEGGGRIIVRKPAK